MTEAPDAPHRLTDLRVLLLGNKAAGKSSSICTILGSEEPSPRTAQCVKIRGEAEGTALTVVEAPGWWRNYSVKDSPNLNAQEIVLAASLCPPGPHAVLLVVRLDTPFTETCRRTLEERQGLFLSGSVWSHSMVLFTFGDCLEDTPVWKHMESQGEALRWLVEKCGNRVHVFNNKDRSNSRQVKELLEKIEAMVAGNGGRSFEVDSELLRGLGVRRRTEETRAVERLMRVQRQKQALACRTAETQQELRVLLVGHRHSGKSSAGNVILGREEFDLRRTSKCVIKRGKVAGRPVTVVEAPGWWNNYRVKDTPQLTKQELLSAASLCPPGPHVLLLVVRADGSFTTQVRKATEEHLELFGEKVWDHTMVLFTYGDWLGDTGVEQHIESEGESLRWLVETCGNRYHIFNNSDSGDGSQVTELLQKVDEMIAGHGGRHYEVDSVSLEEVRMQQKIVEERAKSRLLKVMEERQTIGRLMGEMSPPSELRMVILGSMCSGKSSTVNTILGSREASSPASSSFCVRRQGQVGSRRIVLDEAPGWLRCSYVTETSESVQEEILRGVTLCTPGPHAVLLVVQADASFSMNEKRNLHKHLILLGPRIWDHAVVLFTCGDWLGDCSVEEHIESEGGALQWLVETCGNRYHVLNNKDNSESTQVMELLDKIEDMVAANGGRLVQVPYPPLVKTELKYEDVEMAAKILSNMPIRKARSMQHSQPTMGGDDRWDTSSDYDSGASLQMSNTGNASVRSSMSSGFGSWRKGLRALSVFTKRPKLEEDPGCGDPRKQDTVRKTVDCNPCKTNRLSKP